MMCTGSSELEEILAITDLSKNVTNVSNYIKTENKDD